LFLEAGGEELAARIPSAGPGARVAGVRFPLEISGQSFLVAVPEQSAGPGGVVGVLLDAGALGAIVEGALAALADPRATEWVLKGRDGRTVLPPDASPTGPISLNATFPGNFPPWLLELHRRPQSPMRLLFASSRSLYLYMFLLIGTILVFGLVLTVRAVSQELELARLKSDFLSTVSHEFRSPLTSIRHVAEMLQSGSVPSEERRLRYYDLLVEQATRLSSLVTNVLDLARIEEGRQEFRFEAVDPGELVRELVDATRQRVRHEGFVVEARLQEPLPAVRADRVALTQALSNLLDNAIRYSGESKRIDLLASADDTHLILAVADQGVGIPAEERGKVFDRFFRGGNPLTRSVKGSGLGLALVKEIVEAHGGTMQVQSEVGRGSTFSIRLPLTRE
jgi:signal transduction histidine kinase